MTVRITLERLRLALEHLAQVAYAPSNRELARVIRVGARTLKPESGAVVIRGLELAGAIQVVRGRNWRVIRVCESGRVIRSRLAPKAATL